MARAVVVTVLYDEEIDNMAELLEIYIDTEMRWDGVVYAKARPATPLEEMLIKSELN